MTMLGTPTGIFDLDESDRCVGSYLKRSDLREIFNVPNQALDTIEFAKIDGIDVVDERQIQKHWYTGKITGAPRERGVSLDELILLAIFRRSLPNAIIERQVRVGNYKMDFKLTYNGQTIFVEFDGPTHFIFSRYGAPRDPFEKKKKVEDKTGIEVVNWAYWIQRCSANAKALFDRSVAGYGALWSTNVHFGDFYFDNSADIITSICQRFNAVDNDGCGYFYGPNTKGRNNPEHPIIEKIANGRESIERLLPKGAKYRDFWLPRRLRQLSFSTSPSPKP